MGDAPRSDLPSEDDPLEEEAAVPQPSTHRDSSGGERERFPGDEWLVGDSPRQVLERLVDQDPLHFEDHCRLFLRQEGYVLGLERLVLRSMARVAMEAMSYQGKPALSEWLRGRVRVAADELLREQWAEEYRDLPPMESEDRDLFLEFAEVTGIEPGLSRLACAELNQLPRRMRLAFVDVYLEGQPMKEWAEDHDCPLDEAGDLITQAINRISITLEERRTQDGEDQ